MLHSEYKATGKARGEIRTGLAEDWKVATESESEKNDALATKLFLLCRRCPAGGVRNELKFDSCHNMQVSRCACQARPEQSTKCGILQAGAEGRRVALCSWHSCVQATKGLRPNATSSGQGDTGSWTLKSQGEQRDMKPTRTSTMRELT